MRIGISCSDSTFTKRYGENAYNRIKEFGFCAVDIDLTNTDSEYYSLTEEHSDKILLHHRRLCDKAGIEIFQVHGPWRWPPRDDTEERRAERLEKMKKSVRMATILGARYWVVHPIMPFGIEDIGTGNEKKTWELNLVFMRELLKAAHEYDVIICLENMPMTEFSLATPEKILEFVKEMNDDHFAMCFDTGHAQVFGSRGMKLGDEVRRCGEYIKCFHIHDNKQERDLHQFPTFGASDWHDFAKALKDIRYDGVFNLETVPPMSLSDKLFWDSCTLLYGIANEILGYEGL